MAQPRPTASNAPSVNLTHVTADVSNSGLSGQPSASKGARRTASTAMPKIPEELADAEQQPPQQQGMGGAGSLGRPMPLGASIFLMQQEEEPADGNLFLDWLRFCPVGMDEQETVELRHLVSMCGAAAMPGIKGPDGRGNPVVTHIFVGSSLSNAQKQELRDHMALNSHVSMCHGACGLKQFPAAPKTRQPCVEPHAPACRLPVPAQVLVVGLGWLREACTIRGVPPDPTPHQYTVAALMPKAPSMRVSIVGRTMAPAHCDDCRAIMMRWSFHCGASCLNPHAHMPHFFCSCL